jgi:hypothetical protein
MDIKINGGGIKMTERFGLLEVLSWTYQHTEAL